MPCVREACVSVRICLKEGSRSGCERGCWREAGEAVVNLDVSPPSTLIVPCACFVLALSCPSHWTPMNAASWMLLGNPWGAKPMLAGACGIVQYMEGRRLATLRML